MAPVGAVPVLEPRQALGAVGGAVRPQAPAAAQMLVQVAAARVADYGQQRAALQPLPAGRCLSRRHVVGGVAGHGAQHGALAQVALRRDRHRVQRPASQRRHAWGISQSGWEWGQGAGCM